MGYILRKKIESPLETEQRSSAEEDAYIAHRRSICNACERKNPFNDTCMECGCPILELNRNKAKKCPLGKW